MKYLIYLLFGKNKGGLKSELIYSLFSLDKVADEWCRKNVEVLIYTDEKIEIPPRLAGISISFSFLDPKDIEEWIRKGNGCSLILKAMVMQDFLRTFLSTGIFIDTDTYFTRNPAPLFKTIGQGYILMHLKEYPFNHRPEIHSYFSRKSIGQSNGPRINGTSSYYMWNSGVIGVNPACATLMPEIISLIEQMAYDKEWSKDNHRLLEQVSYSYHLQLQKSKLLAAENYIVHYWFFKQSRFLLAKYFDFFYGSDIAELEKLIQENGLEDSEFNSVTYDELPLMMFRLMKKFEMIENYHFECLPSDSYIGKVLRSCD
ncbi:MAG: hypothetical protein ABIR18_01490 [Chitinophagaceae bacterium]